MATIATKILIVGEAGLGISFNLTQDPTNCTFTISQFLYLIRNNTQAVFSVDTASRRTDPSATFQNFTFSNASLVKYNVLWLFGYEGLDDNQLQPTPGTGPISDAERLAILAFMDRGGGVFATGDHSGLGSFMCGNIPRVRTMRKWYGRQVDLPPDRQTGLDLHGNTVSMVNWSGLSGSSNSGLPRLDTLRHNVSDAAGVYDFDNQSDNIPQTLFVVQPAHPILQASDESANAYGLCCAQYVSCCACGVLIIASEIGSKPQIISPPTMVTVSGGGPRGHSGGVVRARPLNASTMWK